MLIFIDFFLSKIIIEIDKQLLLLRNYSLNKLHFCITFSITNVSYRSVCLPANELHNVSAVVAFIGS